jgi:hypothetical protein
MISWPPYLPTFSLAATMTSRSCKEFAPSATQSRAHAKLEVRQQRGVVPPTGQTNHIPACGKARRLRIQGAIFW